MPGLRRRDLLKAGGAGVLALSLPATLLRRAMAEEGRVRTLVVLFLRGGADPLSAFVPHGDERYYALRPTLAIAPEDTEASRGVIALDKTFGLHPALAPLHPYWKSGRFAGVLNVGSPHPTRSHFDAQDFMEYAAPGSRTIRDGWLNRYLALPRTSKSKRDDAEPALLRALAMQGLLPRSLRGEIPVLAVPDQRVLADDQLLDLFEPLYDDDEMGGRSEKDDPVLTTGRNTVKTLKRFRDIVKRPRRGGGAKYPENALGKKLAAIATVIRADEGLQLAAVDIGGWDTHANQGATEGTMGRLLGSVGGSLAAFADDLGPRLDDTLIVTMSEFGRTCRENGNYGTDHGHGGFMMLLGGSVAGGRLHGKWDGLAEKAMYQGRDLPVTTDFRDVFATVLRDHLRFDVPKGFFPDHRISWVRDLFAKRR